MTDVVSVHVNKLPLTLMDHLKRYSHIHGAESLNLTSAEAVDVIITLVSAFKSCKSPRG